MSSNKKKLNINKNLQANKNEKINSTEEPTNVLNKTYKLSIDKAFSNEYPLFNNTKRNKITLSIILFIVVIAYGVLLFWNIPYPMFWADESMTAMQGSRVVQFGYPKLHDGKNVLYDLEHPDTDIGRDKNTDAFVGGTGWLHYYFAAPFVAISKNYTDFYVKTAIIRTPFAIIGSIGLIFFLLSLFPFLKNSVDKLFVSIVFCFLCCLSVPLLLHLREVRYYSLIILLYGIMIFLISNHRIKGNFNKYVYLILLSITLLLMFFAFSPGYFIALGIIGIYELLNIISNIIKHKNTKNSSQIIMNILKANIIYILPIIITFLILLPCFSYFKTFIIADAVDKLYHNEFRTYKLNFVHLIKFFSFYELLIPFILVKIVILIIRPKLKKSNNTMVLKYLKLSNFLLIAFFLYLLLISHMSYYVFNRYFISTIPILNIMIIMDFYIIANYYRQLYSKSKKLITNIISFSSIGFIAFYLIINSSIISGKLYETFHKNQNTLDHAIKFVADNFKRSDTLTIATNYEETSWMFYLNCKVVVGFVGNNKEEDPKANPDIIVYRRMFPSEYQLSIFNGYLKSGNYQPLLLPYYDAMFNNIPEICDDNLKHIFIPPVATKNDEKLQIYIKKDLLANKNFKF